MKLRTKKIIAREFLILLLSFVISGIVFVSIYTYNYYQTKQIEKLGEDIQKNQSKSHDLNLQYKLKNEKQLSFHNELNEFIYTLNHPKKIKARNSNSFYDALDEYEELSKTKSNPIYYKNGNLSEFDTSVKYMIKSSSVQFDLIKNFASFGKQFGFATPENFTDFINHYSITVDDVAKNNEATKINDATYLLINKKSTHEAKIFSTKRQLDIVFISFLIIAFILFPFRYIFYSLKWSISTLRQKV